MYGTGSSLTLLNSSHRRSPLSNKFTGSFNGGCFRASSSLKTSVDGDAYMEGQSDWMLKN